MGPSTRGSPQTRRGGNNGPGAAAQPHAVTLGRAEAMKIARLHPRHEPRRAPRWVRAFVGYFLAPALILGLALAAYLVIHR